MRMRLEVNTCRHWQPCRCLQVLGVLLMLTDAAIAAPDPCTLYKPEQIAIARANIQQHPWAKSILDAYKRQIAFVMSKDRAFIDGMVSELTPWPVYGQSCPVCVGKLSSMGETGIYQWSPEKPDHLVCKYCKTVFPNPAYPETGHLTAPHMGQTFTYYETPEERAHPADKSGKYAFRWASWPVHTSWSGMIRGRKAAWVAEQILPLAKVYALTGDTAYAEHAAWCLAAIARAYPHWLYHSYNGTYADVPPGAAAAEMGKHPPAGKFDKAAIITAFPYLVDRNGDGFGELNNGFWGAGRLETGADGEGMVLLAAAVGYDLIRDARTADGTPVLTPQMRTDIEQNLLLAGCADLDNYPAINNKCGPGRALSGAIGLLFQRPEEMRRALDGFEKLLGDDFHFDGFCRESPSYSSMHLSLMQDIPEILSGYSDPPGFQPVEGPRFDHFDPFVHVPRYRLALESMVRMLAPGGRFPVIGDTHAGNGITPIYAEILAAHYGARYAGLLQAAQGAPLPDRGSEYALWHRRPDLTASANAQLPLRTEWFPGWHVGVLRAGGPESTTAFYFNGYEMHGHRHDDTLGIIYYDHGKELASDRGYIWDDPRNAWTRSTLAHNIVTVDGANQTGKDRHSVLELFGKSPEVEVVQASANAYSQCTEYRRTCALIRVNAQQTYAVDFFRVQGGKQHLYGFNCQGTFLGVAGADPRPIPGKLSWLENLREAKPAANWTATWEYQGVKMELRMPTPAERMLVTDAPGWRSNRGAEMHAPPITQVLAERDGANLQSCFAAVMTPYAGAASPVQSARLLTPEPGGGEAIAVEVRLADRTDYLVTALDDQPRTYGPVTVAGRFAYVSLDSAGRVRAAYLLAGTRLACAGQTLTLPAARTECRAAGVSGQAFTLITPVDAAAVAAGTYFLADGTGYEIESASGKSITVRDYPPQYCEKIEILHSAWFSRGEKP